MMYDWENPFSEMIKSDPETVTKYFEVEEFHVLPEDYLNKIAFRRRSMRLIKQFGDPFPPVVPYLALTIFDNLISNFEIPEKMQSRKNCGKIFIVCCFLSVWRMICPELLLSIRQIYSDLNVSVEDMAEFTSDIEKSLKSRNCMPLVTSLCFLDYLIGLLTELDQLQMRCLKSFTTKKLYALKYDIGLAEFKPSIVAAAALAASVNTLYGKKLGYVINIFLHCEHLNKESLKRSVEMLIPDVTVCLTTIEELVELSEVTFNKFLELLNVTRPDLFDDSDTDTATPASPPPDP